MTQTKVVALKEGHPMVILKLS